jgi:hypothetical protein
VGIDLAEKETLNLDPHQVRQAESQKQAADGAVTARLPETYQWLLVPEQINPPAPITWQAMRLSGSDALAVRASKKLRNDELLITALAGTRLRMELDRVPLWRGNHVGLKQLAEDFAQYLYLPHLRDADVLLQAIQNGISLLSWKQDTFAYAEGWDEAKARYRGLRAGHIGSVTLEGESVLVKPEVAATQLVQEQTASLQTTEHVKEDEAQAYGRDQATTVSTGPKRFFGTVVLDTTRTARDAGQIAEEVIQHLQGLMGSEVEVTLEIHAKLPDGASDHIVRTVTENCRTLRFKTYGFEEE